MRWGEARDSLLCPDLTLQSETTSGAHRLLQRDQRPITYLYRKAVLLFQAGVMWICWQQCHEKW